MPNMNEIDHKILATHFADKFSNTKSATEAMRQLKKKHEAGNGGLWSIYVKAYKYDKIVESGAILEGMKHMEAKDEK